MEIYQFEVHLKTKFLLSEEIQNPIEIHLSKKKKILKKKSFEKRK